jgi:hypothetical protein
VGRQHTVVAHTAYRHILADGPALLIVCCLPIRPSAAGLECLHIGMLDNSSITEILFNNFPGLNDTVHALMF